jgi:uncharacterized membrane protein YphA (DoxX/SURF4 family)
MESQFVQAILGNQHLALTARILLAALLLGAGMSKIVKVRDFEEVVRGYELLPQLLVPAFARVLPVAELLAGISLLIDPLAQYGALAGLGLFATFGAAVAINLVRGRRSIACGCFGKHGQQLSWVIVTRNGILGAVAGLVWAGPPTGTLPETTSSTTWITSALMVVALTGSFRLIRLVTEMWSLKG